MEKVDLAKVLEDSGAILHGHFILTSGRRSAVYFEKFRVLEQPHVLSRLCTELAEFGKRVGATLVVGPTTGGIIVAAETGRQMGLEARYVESVEGKKTLRRNATIPAGAKVLVVDDVLTTGKSVFEVVDLLREMNVEIVGVGVLISRAEKPIDFGCEMYAAYTVSAESYAADEIPESLKAIPPVKPGTRQEPILR